MPESSGGAVRGTIGGIRFRITAVAALAVLVVLLVTSVGLVRLQERSLIQSLDEALEQGASNVEEAIATRGVPAAVAGFGDDDTTVQLVDADGNVVVATRNAEGAAAPGVDPPAGNQHIETTADVSYGEDSYRVLARTVETDAGRRLTLYVAAPTDDIEESIATLTASLTLAVPVVVFVLAVVIWILVGRTLRPVEDIRAEVSTISASDLNRRVSEPATNDEIASLARTMNAMLERVQVSVDRQQRFVADASHELRTPLTRMRSELEVDLAHPDEADTLATHRSVLEETASLERLLDDLLLLARGDADAPGALDTLIDLDDLVFRAAERVDDPRLRVDVSAVRPAQVRGSESQLARAVGNVVDNASKYAESVITLRLDESSGEVVLEVNDDGPGIPSADVERVFERFTRLDDSRTAATGGTGLGLAIARDIAIRHGGSITVGSDHGAIVVIRLPPAGPAS